MWSPAPQLATATTSRSAGTSVANCLVAAADFVVDFLKND
jgi:hypothetical protein